LTSDTKSITRIAEFISERICWNWVTQAGDNGATLRIDDCGLSRLREIAAYGGDAVPIREEVDVALDAISVAQEIRSTTNEQGHAEAS